MSKYVHEEDGSVVSLPWIRPSSLLLYLLTSYQWLLLGGCEVVEQAEAMLQSFWDNYKVNHPSHTVFNRSPVPLKRTIPVALHGDGARTQKCSPLRYFLWKQFWVLTAINARNAGMILVVAPKPKKDANNLGTLWCNA